MPKEEFIKELEALGYKVDNLDGNKIVFDWVVPSGKLVDQKIRLGFEVPTDFSISSPSGPHVSPRLLPINTQGGTHPNCGVHESTAFGPEWQYWSRPISHWAQTKRTVRDVLAHVRHLFDTL